MNYGECQYCGKKIACEYFEECPSTFRVNCGATIWCPNEDDGFLCAFSLQDRCR